MRKYIIGALFGIALTLTSSVFAADITSVIGKVIQGQFNVEIDGAQLDKPAIVVDGASYLPVRAFGDATGYDVTFNAELGIVLKKKETVSMSTTATIVSNIPIADQIKTLDDKIKTANERIVYYSKGLEVSKLHEDAAGINSYTKTIDDFKTMITDLEKQKADLTAAQ